MLLALFSFHLTQEKLLAAESYYEINPEKTPEEQLLEEIAMNGQSGISTNRAYNETDEFKTIMKNFKSVDFEDYDETSKLTDTENTEEISETSVDNMHPSVTQNYSVDEGEISSYNNIKNIIAQRSEKKRESQASNGDNTSKKASSKTSANTNSSVSYSLVNRTDRQLPPPVYLCGTGGKIVINITVNASGDVVNAYVNTSSSSKNECLIDSALEYAKKARFSADASRESQIGSITYYFQGKN